MDPFTTYLLAMVLIYSIIPEKPQPVIVIEENIQKVEE